MVFGGACMCIWCMYAHIWFSVGCGTYICYGACIHTSSILVVFGGACMCMLSMYVYVLQICWHMFLVVHVYVCGAWILTYVFGGGCGTCIYYGGCGTYICYGACMYICSILVVFGGASMCMFCMFVYMVHVCWCMFFGSACICMWYMCMYVVHESSHMFMVVDVTHVFIIVHVYIHLFSGAHVCMWCMYV